MITIEIEKANKVSGCCYYCMKDKGVILKIIYGTKADSTIVDYLCLTCAKELQNLLALKLSDIKPKKPMTKEEKHAKKFECICEKCKKREMGK